MNGSLCKIQCRGIWWACSAVCEGTGWGGKGARNPVGFPFLQKEMKGKAYLSLGVIETMQDWLSLNCWETKGLPHTPESCTAFHSEVGDNGRTKAEPWLWQLVSQNFPEGDGTCDMLVFWGKTRTSLTDAPPTSKLPTCPQFPLVLEVSYIQNGLGVSVRILSLSSSDMVTYFAPLHLSCTLLPTVSLGALSNIANLVWPQSAAVFFWIHLLYWIPVPGGTSGPVVQIRLLSYKSEGLGKLAYFTSEKGDWSNC